MFKVVVVATDGSGPADLAMSFAKDLAVDQKARLVVVFVDELVPGHGGAHHVQALEPELRSKISDQVAALKSGGLEAEGEFRQVTLHGPAHAIADAAAETKADLIILGSVGSGPLKGLLLGSVAHRLLQIAPCPVLVVPARHESPS
jgi:nucleotide-binding universal stress UspA family protein